MIAELLYNLICPIPWRRATKSITHTHTHRLYAVYLHMVSDLLLMSLHDDSSALPVYQWHNWRYTHKYTTCPLQRLNSPVCTVSLPPSILQIPKYAKGVCMRVCVCVLSSSQSELVHTCCGYKTILGKQHGRQSLHSCFCLRWTMAEIVRLGKSTLKLCADTQ